MALRISPQEFKGDEHRFVIITKVPKDEIADQDVLVRVERANLAVGDALVVKCVNFEETLLLHEAEYRVVGRQEMPVTKEVDDRASMYSVRPQYIIARMTEWWTSPAGRAAEKLAKEKAEQEAAAQAEVGKKGKAA